MKNDRKSQVVVDMNTLSGILTTYDAAYSLRLFIEEFYAGCIEFEDDRLKNSVILFDKKALAFAMKAIIKALTLKRVCKISFESSGPRFIILFKTFEPLPSSVFEELNLTAEECGFSLEYADNVLRLVIPALEKSILALYERMQKTFFFVLRDVFFGF